LRRLMWSIVEQFADGVAEILPEPARTRRRLVALPVALRDAHFPENENALATAHRRLAFDDFLFLQLGLAILRSRTTRARGVALNPPGALLTSASRPRERKARRAALAAGEIACVVGTHALVQESVEFRRLGLAVVDEQHRFGVEQRARLRAKGEHPDLLVMTATPIPRTLALTLYGDLDVSVLDEMPPGRQPIKTVARTESKRAEIYEFVRKQISEGRQAYVVYPLVEESEVIDLKAATDMARHLQQDIFPELTVGLIHGRLGFE